VKGVFMPTAEEFEYELERLAAEEARERRARAKSYDMHGGDHRNPMEEPMPIIIAQFGDWAVTPFGVECLVYPYQIQWDSLTDTVTGDDYWLEKLAGKDWVVQLRDFTEALRVGRQVHRYLHGIE
jgi:hypothetical protein